MTFASGLPARIIDGRECGRCSLCCKAVRVNEINKPPGQWCKHCAPGRGGCIIYATRPTPCRHFLCMWLVTEELGEDWFPASAKLVVSMEAGGKRISVSVDPSSPARWREEPYYSRIKGWARFGATVNSQVLVNVGKKVTVVLPNKDIDLGEVESEDHIMIGELNVPAGHLPDWDAWVVKAADIPEDQRDKWIER